MLSCCEPQAKSTTQATATKTTWLPASPGTDLRATRKAALGEKEHQTSVEGTEKLALRSHVPKELNMGWTQTAANTGLIYPRVLWERHQAAAEVWCQRQP